ncbi:hypothetical protein DL93DRAFT_2096617 [Clavulina sp. PMI_390]|nr:hypothetical protein DL93DRAFT_2096617 [Clavulina sp. PMI_390]
MVGAGVGAGWEVLAGPRVSVPPEAVAGAVGTTTEIGFSASEVYENLTRTSRRIAIVKGGRMRFMWIVPIVGSAGSTPWRERMEPTVASAGKHGIMIEQGQLDESVQNFPAAHKYFPRLKYGNVQAVLERKYESGNQLSVTNSFASRAERMFSTRNTSSYVGFGAATTCSSSGTGNPSLETVAREPGKRVLNEAASKTSKPTRVQQHTTVTLTKAILSTDVLNAAVQYRITEVLMLDEESLIALYLNDLFPVGSQESIHLLQLESRSSSVDRQNHNMDAITQALFSSQFRRANSRHQPDCQDHPQRTSSGSWIIVRYTLVAAIPLGLGVFFLISLRLGSPHGVYYANHTFRRCWGLGDDAAGLSYRISLAAGLSVKREISLSPLAVPVSSHIRYDSTWICVHSRRIPLVHHLSTALHKTCRYISKTRAPLTPMILVAASFSLIFFILSVGTKVVDTVLHNSTTSTILPQNAAAIVNGMIFVLPDCNEQTQCPVSANPSVASAGGRNASDNFSIYESILTADSSAVASGMMAERTYVSFIGPHPTPLSFTSQTIAVGTECHLRRPSCLVNSTTETIEACSGIGDPYSVQYGTSVMQERPELLIMTPWIDDDLTADFGTTHPNFTHIGFMCFPAYVDLPHNETFSNDTGSGIPDPTKIIFMEWFRMLALGSDPEAPEGDLPKTFCFTYTCSTLVFDATYSVSQGEIRLDLMSLNLTSSIAAPIAVSRTLPFYGSSPALTGKNAQLYPRSTRYLDAQLQADVTLIANDLGSDVDHLALEFARMFSNRLLGWSAGALQLDPILGIYSVDVLAISIPIITSWVFIVLLLLLALFILLLGISAPFLHTKYHSVAPTTDHDSPTSPTEHENHMVSDIFIAQQRLSDTSTLVHEIVLRHWQLTSLQNATSRLMQLPISPTRDQNRRRGPSPLGTVAASSDVSSTDLDGMVTTEEESRNSRNGPRLSVSSRKRQAMHSRAGSVTSLTDLETQDMSGTIKIGIRPDTDGPLRLQVDFEESEL